MNSQLIKTLAMVIAGATFILGCQKIVASENKASKGTQSMSIFADKSQWKTHCVGRLLIDLPPSQFTNGADYSRQILFDDKIEYMRNIKTPEQLRTYVQKQEDIIKSGREYNLSKTGDLIEGKKRLIRKDNSNWFVKKISRPNGGVSILEYDTSMKNASFGNSYIMTNYFVTPNQFRVFKYTNSDFLTDKNFTNIENFNINLAKNLYARDGIPTQSGLCIDSGFIKDDPIVPNRWEALTFSMAYPYFNNEYQLTAGIGVEVLDRPEIKDLKEKEPYAITSGRKVFRDQSKTVAGFKGELYDIKTNGNNHYSYGFPVYSLGWDYEGIIDSSLSPAIGIGLFVEKRDKIYMPDNIADSPQFPNATEALKVWDEILSTVRTFPTRKD